MEALKNAAEQAKAGHGQIVAAMAEAGVGKSRLFYEFKAISQSGCMVLEALSFSHGKASALLPVIELLWNYFKITSEDDERTRREKITGRVLALDRSLEDALPHLYALLGLADENTPQEEIEPQTRKRSGLQAIKRILLRESLNQPLIVIFEDLHWIDDGSQAFLNLLADSIGTAKILLLVNYRPEYSHQWNSKTYYTQLRLDPLGRESAEEMLTALLGDAVELGPLKRLIIEKTEGNPFYMEEMVQVLFEEGTLVRNGAVKITRSLSQLKIPATVQAILAARIDRLPADEKELVQTLAVIGKEFPLTLVREVASADELERSLEHLQLAEFIYEQPAMGDVEYTFKHALTQEVAYSSVLVERRRGLHQRVAEAVESLNADRLDDHYTELARHFDRSGDVDNAVRYLYLAGQQALSRSAFHEALGCATRALELVGSLPESRSRAERELGLQFVLGGALYWVEGPASEDWGVALARARELSLVTGSKEDGLSALAGLSQFHMFRGELQRAVELGREVVEMAQETKFLRLAHAGLGRTLLHVGEFQESIENLERALSLPEAQSFDLTHGLHSFPYASHAGLLNFLSNALWFRGFPDQAMRRSREALQLARESRNFPLLAVVLVFAADFFIRYGEEDRLRECIETFPAVAAEMEPIPGPPRLIEIRKGWLLVERGELQEGIGAIRNGIAALLATGCKYHDSFHRALLALAYVRANQVDNAFGSLDDALRFVEQSGERYYEAELYRLRGELLLACGRASDEEEIQGCFRKAIEVARRQDAKSWELRATMSLARLLDKQDRRDEARTMLADIYNWFTEGFDTADLKDAKSLLNELST
jgi:tetratricopeptide (TPR) repeat protein